MITGRFVISHSPEYDNHSYINIAAPTRTSFMPRVVASLPPIRSAAHIISPFTYSYPVPQARCTHVLPKVSPQLLEVVLGYQDVHLKTAVKRVM
jgi:hypothetical protein